MSFVLDASVSACWFLPDEDDPIATAAMDRLNHGEAHAPLIWWFEIRNVLVMAARKKPITPVQAATFFTLLDTLPIRCETLPDPAQIGCFARRYRLTFYDAAYLETAIRRKLPLASLDKELLATARAEGAPLFQP